MPDVARLQVGALQPHRGLLAGQRPRGEDAGQAQGDAGAVPAGGGEVQRAAARQLAVPARDRAAAERRRRERPSSPTPARTPAFRSATRRTFSNKSFTITAEIDVPKGGGDGMIVTDGGRFGGYGLYLLKGKPVFVYNLLDLKRTRWEGGVGSRDCMGDSLSAGQAHDRVRLHVRRPRHRQGRHRRAEGGRPGARHGEARAHDPVPAAGRRDLRRRRRHPHAGRRQTTRCRSASTARSTS